ncbi:antibiotic biosynthesis monooxygenase [Erythrobacter citreus]|uniref:Antibiotic biosynthesis monooxygenase n=1 Tax=Qipengyuania citrea TaxID=225971 RepID=A0A6I4UG08_9SPHN|nr:putative quinol monooxygenase [Qipengyuania citrea]MDQ0564714.1 quinol monooxygenase YgiN [Qipengyuania citrea]MXP36259.1 antibiotic biosynthesis monooxygenase [Qipengyuania citrea]
MIQINGTIRLGRSIDAATRKAIVEMVRASRAEEGCIDYAFANDLADPDTLILFERWRDQAALDAHGKSDHMAAFQEFMGANPPEASDLRIYDTDEGQPLR